MACVREVENPKNSIPPTVEIADAIASALKFYNLISIAAYFQEYSIFNLQTN